MYFIDPVWRTRRGHELQEVMKALTPRERAIVDAAVKAQRTANVPARAIAEQLGGVSVQRVSQMANSKHNGKVRRVPSMIYAVRITAPGESWYGDARALPPGQYRSGMIEFNNPQVHNRFTGHRLELRYGPVPDDGLIPAMQAFTTVDGHRCRATAKVQRLLFTDEATDDA